MITTIIKYFVDNKGHHGYWNMCRKITFDCFYTYNAAPLHTLHPLSDRPLANLFLQTSTRRWGVILTQQPNYLSLKKSGSDVRVTLRKKMQPAKVSCSKQVWRHLEERSLFSCCASRRTLIQNCIFSSGPAVPSDNGTALRYLGHPRRWWALRWICRRRINFQKISGCPVASVPPPQPCPRPGSLPAAPWRCQICASTSRPAATCYTVRSCDRGNTVVGLQWLPPSLSSHTPPPQRSYNKEDEPLRGGFGDAVVSNVRFEGQNWAIVAHWSVKVVMKPLIIQISVKS